MKTFKELLWLLLNCRRIMRRGAALCAEQGRAPTEKEYRWVTWQIRQELTKNH